MAIPLTAVVVLTATALIFSVELAAAGDTFSSRLVHGFSDEAMSFWASKGKSMTWPKRESVEHMRLLLSNDLKRQRLKLGSQKQLLFPSEGSETHFYGNDLSWLHYVWIDVGTPNASFLVALDAGSDLLWLPCDCVQCAPLSSSYYSMLDKDLNEYSPARSSTSKHLSCSHQLCELGPNCQSPKERCPYTVNYYSENTSSSGFLFEDQLHLTSVGGHEHQGSVRAPIVIGCGSKQSGNYLNGAAPDGVMGLGPGEISVPSLLAKSGFVPRSFSLCFGKSNSGTIFVGDKGPENQRRSSFVSLDGNYNTYAVEVQHYCVGGTCPKLSGFQALVDSGSSFTFLPSEIFTKVVTEFDQQMNATRLATEDFPYCYKASSQGLPNIPSMKLLLAANQSFVIQNPMFSISSGQDKDLNEYSPARSSTSKHLSCSHQLCELGPNCQSPKERCPYTVNYYSENTSSSGFLFEDQLHLTSVGGHEHQGSVRAPIVIGCGSKQSGNYLNGAAPDGVMGLGPGEISVPSLLAKSGFVPRSFSLCFGKSNSGTIFVGDKGPENQRRSSFVSLDGNYNTYAVEVQHYCVGGTCPKLSGFQALVDSGSSFTFLPSEIFTKVVTEFDQQMNATRLATEDFPYCYKASSQGLPNIPSMKLLLAANQSFVIQNPMFSISSGQGDNFYCVGLIPIEGTIGIIGQNFMEGYRMVFDWENMKLGWSRSKCQDIGGTAKVSPTPPPSGFTSNPLPTTEQQKSPGGHAVAPAIAGKATPKPSVASLHAVSWHYTMSSLLLPLVVWLPYLI